MGTSNNCLRSLAYWQIRNQGVALKAGWWPVEKQQHRVRREHKLLLEVPL